MADAATRILVPIDETENSRRAIPTAERIAREHGAEIVLVSVGELGETSRHAEEVQSRLRGRLDEVAREIVDLPVRTRVELANDPVHGILTAAREESADRIVASTRDLDGLQALGSESVTEGIREEAGVPVIVVHPGPHGVWEEGSPAA